ncbi:MAG: ATP-binding protein [Coleofasciculus chthonoplastes F3-SA18-01]|uniref:sensor histidine kinase n=1 Tax=Coleofasciculus chthonoplastes TaxID=64178 RepID=UPI0032FF89C8
MHFKFSPNILNRLGQELIPNPDQGIIELVKNSYDADATQCTVELINTDTTGGSILISDNGIGMDLAAISEGWFVLGRSKKAAREPTSLGRLPVGDKGLGRLAALKQGSKVQLKTRPKNKPAVEYSLTINWQDFEQASVVEDISFDVQKDMTNLPQGTEILIENLSIKFGRREVKRLARELLFLADPFDSDIAFRPRLIAPEFTDLEKQVNESYFDDAEYHLKSSVNRDGLVEASVLDWKDNLLFHGKHRDIYQKQKEPYKTAPAEFELWIFLLNPQSFSTKTASFGQVRKWLSEVGNVHLYHRGLRVKPYGDQGDDWLNLNYARARNPEVRPSTSTVIGRIIVNDPDVLLNQKTDRLGFIENEAFLELKRFAIDVLNWMAKERLTQTEKRRQIVKQESSRDVIDAKINIENVIEEAVPKPYRTKVRKVIQKYEEVKERETKALREDLQLYRSLATAGTTAAVFAHESGKPVTLINNIAKRIEKKGQELLGNVRYKESLSPPVAMLYNVSRSLLSFSNFPLHLLKREKRRTGRVDVSSAIDDIIELFEPFLEKSKIEIIKNNSDTQPFIRGSTALLEAIITNLLTNAINALLVEGSRTKGRQILISTEIIESYVQIKILDNGLGIRDINLNDIWLPGQTTKPEGTGLGLTIVKDSVTDLGGKVQAIAQGELGGAEFIIKLPLVGG